MTTGRLQELILTYGSELARWPDDERDAAFTLLANSAEAQAMLAEYAPVDALMNAGRDDRAPEGLLDRIMQATEPKKD
jgi:hypothetical protein